MIYNQKNSPAFSGPLRKRLIIGATSVVAAGALLGVGVSGASAATAHPTAAAHVSASTDGTTSAQGTASAHGSYGSASIAQQLRTAFFAGAISGSKAQALATKIIANPALFSALPANLQAALATLKAAPAADATTQAEQLKSTALSGGYGGQVRLIATSLSDSAAYPISTKLVHELRSDLTSGGNSSAIAAKIAKTLSADPALLSTLPANLRGDVKTLRSASPSDASAQLSKIEAAAVSGSYGPQLQQLGQNLASLSGASTK